MVHSIKYRNIPENARIDVYVEQLMDVRCYRVEIFEEYDPHIIELTDINICRSENRRWLEKYVQSLNTKNVYFGSMSLGNFYRLDRYKDFVYDEHIKNALSDLNFTF